MERINPLVSHQKDNIFITKQFLMEDEQSILIIQGQIVLTNK